MIETSSWPQDLTTWQPDEQPFYLEFLGETRRVLDESYAEVVPAGGTDPETLRDAPVYGYWWTPGHPGSVDERRHWYQRGKAAKAPWEDLADPAARVYLYFPVSGGWRIKWPASEVLDDQVQQRPVCRSGLLLFPGTDDDRRRGKQRRVSSGFHPGSPRTGTAGAHGFPSEELLDPGTRDGWDRQNREARAAILEALTACCPPDGDKVFLAAERIGAGGQQAPEPHVAAARPRLVEQQEGRDLGPRVRVSVRPLEHVAQQLIPPARRVVQRPARRSVVPVVEKYPVYGSSASGQSGSSPLV